MALFSGEIQQFIAAYGAVAVALAVGVESIGLPLPGETVLLAAAIYAGTTHRLSIAAVIAAATLGAAIGGAGGFALGRAFGTRLLLRYGPHVGFGEPRIRLGQYLFLRHGGKLVFFGRFIAVLRTLAAVLAGANRMSWRRFLLFNTLGGLVWATGYGVPAYLLGRHVHRVLGPVGLALAAVAVVLICCFWLALRRHEAKWQAEAALALPGPLRHAGHRG